jgi:hypothetical protein
MEAYTVLGIVFLLGVLLYFFVNDPISFIFFALLVGILIFVLVYFGFVKATTQPNELDITYTPRPNESGSTANGRPAPESRAPIPEVFYVSNNIFGYDQATAVCKAYGAELATYNQVEDSYNRGAEWCGYGWTAGGIALFPTQEETWRRLQLEVDPSKRIACGRPGINGGYFDPSTKFGVNCYGVRPEKKRGTISGDQELASSVARIKGMLDRFSISGFNGTDWSEYSGVAKTIISAEADIKGLGADLRKGGSAIGSSVEDIGSGLVEGTGMTLTGIADVVTGAGTNILQGIGSVGQSFYRGLNRGAQSNPASS